MIAKRQPLKEAVSFFEEEALLKIYSKTTQTLNDNHSKVAWFLWLYREFYLTKPNAVSSTASPSMCSKSRMSMISNGIFLLATFSCS